MKKSLFAAFVILLFASPLFGQLNCTTLLKLPAFRTNGFNDIEQVSLIDQNSYRSDLILFDDYEALHVYRNTDSTLQLFSPRLEFETRDEALEVYNTILSEIVSCLGDEWVHTNERYNGSERIRIYRAEFTPKENKGDGELMLLHVRETLTSKKYYVVFSYK